MRSPRSANYDTDTDPGERHGPYIKSVVEEIRLPLAAWISLVHEVDEFLLEAPSDSAERARAAARLWGVEVTPAQAAGLDAAAWAELVMRQLGPRP